MSKNSLKVICPKCLIEHETKLNWSGRGIPKIYCSKCRKYKGLINIDIPSRNGKNRNHLGKE